MDIIHLIGYMATFTVAFSLTPQVIKSWMTKSTKDISIVWNSIYLAGLILYFIYAVGIKEMPIIIGGIIEITLASSLIVAKLLYK